MIAVISPAKTLDFENRIETPTTKARFMPKTLELIETLKTKDPAEIQSLMGISENLAELNVSRYRSFKKNHSEHNSRVCSLAFKGDVYIGLEAESFNQEDFEFSQSHLRILSGLYGLLRPLDLIQPYRLEMGTKLAFDDYKTLYDYWGNKITDLLTKDLKKQGDDIVINLASNEYFKAIKRNQIKARIIDIEFKDLKNGEYKVISFFAKKARGLMSQFMIKNRIENPEELMAFDMEGYYFDAGNSGENNFLFKRD